MDFNPISIFFSFFLLFVMAKSSVIGFSDLRTMSTSTESGLGC